MSLDLPSGFGSRIDKQVQARGEDASIDLLTLPGIVALSYRRVRCAECFRHKRDRGGVGGG